MTKVLFITFQFPPMNVGGSYRPAYFANLLPQHGIQPIVLTINEETISHITNKAIDNSLSYLTENVDIRRTGYNKKKVKTNKVLDFIRRTVSIIDIHEKSWRKEIRKEIDRTIGEEKPQVVYVTVPPFSIGRIGNYVSQKYKLPVIIDIRDSMTHWGNTLFFSYFHFLAVARYERSLFKHASAVTIVTKQLYKNLSLFHKGIAPEKFHHLPNGYYGLKLENFPMNTFSQITKHKDKIIIGYIGSFYYVPKSRNLILQKWWKRPGHRKIQYSLVKEDWLYRSPFFLLKAMKELKEYNPKLGSKIEFHLIGSQPQWLLDMIHDMNLEDNYHGYGFLSQAEMIEKQQKFDFLLATSEKVIDGRNYCLPSKLFSYIKAKKPIIGFVTEGEQKDFLEEVGIAKLVNPDSSKLAKDFENVLLSTDELKLNRKFLEQFDMSNITNKLSQIMRQTITDFEK